MGNFRGLDSKTFRGYIFKVIADSKVPFYQINSIIIPSAECQSFRGQNFEDRAKFMKTSKFSPLENNPLYGTYAWLAMPSNCSISIQTACSFATQKYTYIATCLKTNDITTHTLTCVRIHTNNIQHTHAHIHAIVVSLNL